MSDRCRRRPEDRSSILREKVCLTPIGAKRSSTSKLDVATWAAIVFKRSSRPAGRPKGQGETAPTFLTSLLLPVPVHPWSKAESDCGKCERQMLSSAHQQCRWVPYRHSLHEAQLQFLVLLKISYKNSNCVIHIASGAALRHGHFVSSQCYGRCCIRAQSPRPKLKEDRKCLPNTSIS